MLECIHFFMYFHRLHRQLILRNDFETHILFERVHTIDGGPITTKSGCDLGIKKMLMGFKKMLNFLKLVYACSMASPSIVEICCNFLVIFKDIKQRANIYSKIVQKMFR